MDESSSGEGPRRGDDEGRRGTPARRLGLIGFLIELVLPVALTAALLLVAAGHLPIWDLHTEVGLGIFGVLLVAISLFLSVRIDLWTLAGRTRRGKSQLLNRASPRARLVKYILGGVLIPIGVFVAANRVELPNHETPMALATEIGRSVAPLSATERLGAAVLHARSANAKVQGMLALQAVGSGEALDQLLRVLHDDSSVLADGVERDALSHALASFGPLAVPPLVKLIDGVSPEVRRVAPGPPGDLFTRYLAPAFAACEEEIKRTPDTTARADKLAQVEAAKVEAERLLGQGTPEAAPLAPERALPVFVMDTLLRTDVKQDDALLAFARRIAADAGWSDAVRGQALLLIAKLGGKDDLDGLYSFIDGPSALLQERALEAIAELQKKINAAPPS